MKVWLSLLLGIALTTSAAASSSSSSSTDSSRTRDYDSVGSSRGGNDTDARQMGATPKQDQSQPSSTGATGSTDTSSNSRPVPDRQ
jgi:hypothetical protein